MECKRPAGPHFEERSIAVADSLLRLYMGRSLSVKRISCNWSVGRIAYRIEFVQ